MDRAEAIKILVRSRPAFDIGKSTVFTEAYDMAIAALREQEQSKWVSVKERLPEENEVVLAWVAPCADLHFCFGCELKAFEATHWMPLPEPPKEGAEG